MNVAHRSRRGRAPRPRPARRWHGLSLSLRCARTEQRRRLPHAHMSVALPPLCTSPAGRPAPAADSLAPNPAERQAFAVFLRLLRAGIAHTTALASLSERERELVLIYQRKCERRVRARAVAASSAPWWTPAPGRTDRRPRV